MISSTEPTPEFWKQKLAAFLHDSPSKALDIGDHQQRAYLACSRTGLTGQEFDHIADHIAAAADRLPFPWRRITSQFNGVDNQFHHPLPGGSPCRIAADRSLQVTDAEATEGNLQPLVETPANWSEGQKWRARFFAHWRVWRRNCWEHTAYLGFLPADTRIPDHSIWQHMGIVSALASTAGKPAFLKFQIGPVQDFIVAARSTRDLWSASYLLSWLMAKGLAALASEIGPDSVVFPSLFAQPLFDLQFKESLWSKVQLSENRKSESLWESLKRNKEETLTPNLPNVFLAIVPAQRGEELARLVEATMREEWRRIADTVFEFSADLFPASLQKDNVVPPDFEARFNAQISRHLDIAWQVTPWPETLAQALALGERFLPLQEGGKPNDVCERLKEVITYFTKTMPYEHRDARYYVGEKEGPKEELNNIGLAWSVLVCLNGWQLDGVRQTRAFPAWSAGGWEGRSSHNSKDALTGREEMLAGGAVWHKAIASLSVKGFSGLTWGRIFRHADEFGAVTLVKRTWHLAYLEKQWGLPRASMPDTHQIAKGKVDEIKDDYLDATDPESSDEKGCAYYAVLALDGDSIGQIVSGAKNPKFRTQLSDYTVSDGRKGALTYFEENEGTNLLELQRPLSPSFHLQFSEALANFALKCVGPILSAHKGKLLYAGGDDVLAMVPATEALACADALQRAFRGESSLDLQYKLASLAEGFLARTDVSENEKPIPFILPGKGCTASVGIAVAHFKSPLQDVVKEAQAAEKRAKRHTTDKHAISISVLKRSGEISQWTGAFGTDFDEQRSISSGLAAHDWILYCMREEILSRKFPHRLIELLEPYCSADAKLSKTGAAISDSPEFDAEGVFSAELDIVLERQRGKNWNSRSFECSSSAHHLREALVSYFRSSTSLGTTSRMREMINLLTVTAFLARQDD